MAKVTVTLSLDVSAPTQAQAAAKAKRYARAACKQALHQLPDAWFADSTVRQASEVDGWSNARLTRALEILCRQYLSELARAHLVTEAEQAHVKPVRDEPPYIEDPGADVP